MHAYPSADGLLSTQPVALCKAFFKEYLRSPFVILLTIYYYLLTISGTHLLVYQELP